MKYKKPYYDTGKRFRPTPPLIMLEIGLGVFRKTFEQEIQDNETWKKHPALSQLIMDRSLYLFWNQEQIPKIQKIAKPFIVLLAEACQADAQKTVKIFDGIHNSYAAIQHSAYARGGLNKGDYVSEFNVLFDEYRFRYEELLNRLLSIAYACTSIILREAGLPNSEDYMAVDANQKVTRLQRSILPVNSRYEKIPVIVKNIKPGIRNALSHGGRRTQLDDEESYLLADSSGWSQKFSLKQFSVELETLNEIITALEFGLLVFGMNHIREISVQGDSQPKSLTDAQRSQMLYMVARDCQFEVIDAETAGEYLNIKLRFTPIQPRESEVFGEWGNVRFGRKEAARLVRLKDLVLRFVYVASAAITQDAPGVRIEIYTWGDRLLAKAKIDKAEAFRESTKTLTGKDDVEGKKRIEAEYVNWERLAWADGEVRQD